DLIRSTDGIFSSKLSFKNQQQQHPPQTSLPRILTQEELKCAYTNQDHDVFTMLTDGINLLDIDLCVWSDPDYNHGRDELYLCHKVSEYEDHHQVNYPSPLDKILANEKLEEFKRFEIKKSRAKQNSKDGNETEKEREKEKVNENEDLESSPTEIFNSQISEQQQEQE